MASEIMMHLSMLSPRMGVGWATLGNLTRPAFAVGRDFDTWELPLGQEFDIAAILKDRENLELGI